MIRQLIVRLENNEDANCDSRCVATKVKQKSHCNAILLLVNYSNDFTSSSV